MAPAIEEDSQETEIPGLEGGSGASGRKMTWRPTAPRKERWACLRSANSHCTRVQL
jgi:hypothetical protein